MTTETGNIDNTQGAAIGSGNQAQNVAVNLQTRDLAIEVLERLNAMAIQMARMDAKLDQVQDRTATALVGVDGRMYQLERTTERQHAHDEQDRHTGQSEHVEQHDEVNRRLARIEVIGVVIILLFAIAIGHTLGWW